ncbi:unnamed protein product [Ilex paraguariensis]|uniref:Uncharacterized protein n=1 Tax=Ilex paraguariensis TaxID=185542 RepID=A0ABC8UYY3_9AQUA
MKIQLDSKDEATSYYREGVSDSDFDDRIRLTRPSPQAGANCRVSCTAARESLDKEKKSMFDKALVRHLLQRRSLFAKKNIRSAAIVSYRGGEANDEELASSDLNSSYSGSKILSSTEMVQTYESDILQMSQLLRYIKKVQARVSCYLPTAHFRSQDTAEKR